MNDVSTRLDLLASAGPIIRTKVGQLADRYGLRPWDQEDLEQEFYLRLLVGWNAVGLWPNGTSCSPRGDGETAALHLPGEIDQIATSLVQSWRLWRHGRPAAAGPLTPSACAALTARSSSCRPDAHDLRLDMAVALARLPDGLRELCCRLLLADLTPVAGVQPQQPNANALEEWAAIVAVLRSLFTSLGLHDYL